jgi:hypothetical protein
MKPETARRLRNNRIGLAVGLALILLAAVGKLLGWWNDVEILLGVAGILVSVWYGIGTTSETTVARLEDPLERMAGDMATVRVVLERSDATLGRIEALLRGAR